MIKSSRSHAAPEAKPLEVEMGLRQCAPALPDRLRSRTLANCTARAAAHRRRQKRLQWQLAGAIAVVLAIQTMTLFAVDAQNTYLISGNSRPPLFASLSVAELSQLWHQRSLQLAQLMTTSEVG